jgi:predicted MPP superfamily phosphohydrolase
MKLAWATDIHLGHASESVRRKFYQSVKEQADALVVTGDIAESHILGSALTALATLTERPIYFVLGNHDYYRGRVTTQPTRPAVAGSYEVPGANTPTRSGAAPGSARTITVG